MFPYIIHAGPVLLLTLFTAEWFAIISLHHLLNELVLFLSVNNLITALAMSNFSLNNILKNSLAGIHCGTIFLVVCWMNYQNVPVSDLITAGVSLCIGRLSFIHDKMSDFSLYDVLHLILSPTVCLNNSLLDFPNTCTRAGYREKFQNQYTYVQEFTVTEKYRYFLLSLLVGSLYCRFLNFGDLGTSDVRGV